jgi:hypothetical protein
VNAPSPKHLDLTHPGVTNIAVNLRRVAREHVVEQHVREALAEGWRLTPLVTPSGSGFVLEPLRGAFYAEICEAIEQVLSDFEIVDEAGGRIC